MLFGDVYSSFTDCDQFASACSIRIFLFLAVPAAVLFCVIEEVLHFFLIRIMLLVLRQ